MDTLGLYESEELSLFGRDQLLEWGSPLEPDPLSTFPDNRDDSALELLDHAQTYYENVKASSLNFLQNNQTSPGYTGGLENGWLDTRLDLFNLLQDSEAEAPVSTFESLLSTDNSIGTNVAVVPERSTPNADPISAASLFNQMSGNASVEESDMDADMLSEVLTKLTDYIEVNKDPLDVLHIPDLGNGLSPVSVHDIESLLSFSDVHDSSPNDSGLESLMSSRPDSPTESVQSDPDYELESSSKQSRRKNIRSTPYDSLPKDKKERKKIQNKTAALKYREKKKVETIKAKDDVNALETRNKELKDKVQSLTTEIQYLKNLMAEVLRARGGI